MFLQVHGKPLDSSIARWDHEPNRSRPRNQEGESRTRTRTRRRKGRFPGSLAPPTVPLPPNLSCLLLYLHAGRLMLRGGATKRTTARETGRPMKDALSIPVLEDNDNDVELVRRPDACRAADRNYSDQTFRSTNYYVKLRSQNTQAREWRLDLEKGKRTLMYARRQPSSRATAPGRSGKKRAASLNLSRGTPVLRHSELGQCALRNSMQPSQRPKAPASEFR
jgi:hypothetical protein